MKQKVLFISDFIEGKNSYASIRYDGIMKNIYKEKDFVVISDIRNTIYKSKYAYKNFTFKTMLKEEYIMKKDNSINTGKIGLLKKILKNRLTSKLKMNLLYNKYLFNKKNKILYKEIQNTIKANKISKMFVTFPSIYSLYIAEKIKILNPDIEVILEIRDLINNDLIKSMPKKISIDIEKSIIEKSKKIICVSEGILDYYKKIINKTQEIFLIKNGYNDDDFLDIKKEYKDYNKMKSVEFLHLGNIYEGRNISDFILAVEELSKLKGIQSIINFVGNLDYQALDELERIKNSINNKVIKIKIHGSVSHKEALKFLRDTDISVILTHKKGSDYAIPGKTYEYIASEKPILAVTEDKSLVTLIDNMFGVCCKHNKKDIVDGIIKLFNRNFEYNKKNMYSRKVQAQSILNVLE